MKARLQAVDQKGSHLADGEEAFSTVLLRRLNEVVKAFESLPHN